MPLGVVVRVFVLVAFVHVGLVGGPAIVAEARLRRHVLGPVVAVAVVTVGKRVVLRAVEVDPHRTAFAPGHLVSRAFQHLSRCFGRYWRYVCLRVGSARQRVFSPVRQPVGRELWPAPVPFNQSGAVAALAIQ